MANTLINIWLTIVGPLMLALTSLGAVYIALKTPYITYGEFAGMAVMGSVYALSAWGLWNRIWA